MSKLIRHKQTVKLGSSPGWGSEYWTEKDWKKHREYVTQLKEEGRYLEEVEMTMDIVPVPSFDKQPEPITEGKAVGMLIPMNDE